MTAVHDLGVSNRLRRATIVARRSEPGYRIVLSLLTVRGTPAAETLLEPFATVEAARAFATGELGLDAARIRVDGVPRKSAAQRVKSF